MTELLYGIGLVLFIEGALYALFPGVMLRFIQRMALEPPQGLRIGGLVALFAGFALLWFGRGGL